MNIFRTAFSAAAYALLLLAAGAQAQSADAPALTTNPYAPPAGSPEAAVATAARSVGPVFSQITSFPIPAGFDVAFEEESGNTFIQEWVPKGESVEQWTQMMTLTGSKGGARSGTADNILTVLTLGFKAACPAAYFAANITKEVDPDSRKLVFFGCGTINGPTGAYSETTMVRVLRGTYDFYTLQWAERGPPITQVQLNSPKWAMRKAFLSRFKLCDKVADEGPAYASCS